MTSIPSFPADSAVPEPALCVAAIDIHQSNVSSDLFSVNVPPDSGSHGACGSATSETTSRLARSSIPRTRSDSSQALGSSTDCGSAPHRPSPTPVPLPASAQQQVAGDAVQDLWCPLPGDPVPEGVGRSPPPLAQPGRLSPSQPQARAQSKSADPTRKNQEGIAALQIRPATHARLAALLLGESRPLESEEQELNRVPDA